ncbi:hypothetical protein JCM11641_000815 [Rhodosporidiobolus odoratus]
MASQAPVRALRQALQATARPHLAFCSTSSPFLAAAAPFARQPRLLVPSLLNSRRTFASTTPAAGWLSWRNDKKDELKAKAVEAKEVVEDKAASFSSSVQETVAAAPAPSPEPPIVSTAPVDLSNPTTPSAPTAEAVAPALEGNFYDGIFTGTLDLTSLSGAWGPHPIMRLQSLFLHLHESFPFLGHGLTWAVTIPIVTLFLRFFLFPFQARAQSNAARLAIIQPEMLKGMNKLKDAKARGDFAAMQAAQIETQQLMQKHNVNPIKNLVFPIAQAAVFTCMFFALKGLAGAGLPSMATEGFGWVTDLTAKDPYWILPVTSTALTLATLELGVDTSTQVQTSTTKNMKAIFRVILVCALPFIAYFPAALLLYWTTNNTLSLLQSQLLKTPFVRSLLNIPTPPPKPQPGDANYIPEPSFSEAFKNMQVGAREKWDEQTEKSEKEREMLNRFKEGPVEAKVFTPAVPGAGGRKPMRRQLEGLSTAAQELLASGQAPAGGKGVIEAQPLSRQEQERQRRVAEARRRRSGRK